MFWYQFMRDFRNGDFNKDTSSSHENAEALSKIWYIVMKCPIGKMFEKSKSW